MLGLDLGPIEHVPRARMPDKLPVVLSREEIGQLMKHVEGVMWLIVAIAVLVVGIGAGLFVFKDQIFGGTKSAPTRKQ